MPHAWTFRLRYRALTAFYSADSLPFAVRDCLARSGRLGDEGVSCASPARALRLRLRLVATAGERRGGARGRPARVLVLGGAARGGGGAGPERGRAFPPAPARAHRRA